MILYVGNKLSKHGNTPTSVETLGKLLSEEFQVVSVSDKKNKLFRSIDMVYSVIVYHEKADFILIDTYSTLNFYYAFIVSILANFFKVPYIPILHGGDLERRLMKSPKISRYIFENSHINIAPSPYLETIYKKYGYRVVYIPNNLEINRYRFSPRKQVRPKLLYVRAFSRIYNPMMALKVLKKLSKKYSDASLCMIGPDRDGTFDDIKKEARRLGLENHVRLPGRLDKEEWWRLSEEYDIFINTTDYDNTPVSVMEAMALGLPVVSTNAGGLPYLLENRQDALLVDVGDVAAMVQKISYLIDHPNEVERLTRNARAKVERFDWNAIKRNWIELLRRER